MDLKEDFFKKITFPFFVCLFIISCNQSPNEVPKRLAQKIPSIYKLATDEGFYFKQDTLLFNNEKFSGKQYVLYPSKDTAFVKSYLKGMLEGIQKQWYSNGILAEERLYVANKKEGLHKGWWENGKPKYTYPFYNDELEGEVKEWYATGQLFKWFHYKKGYEEGSERLWYEDGSVRANFVIKNGKKYGLIGIKLCKNPYENTDKL
ncbi:toxin-antitoxin system YwqK family antitoxin [Flavobacterium fluviatile]|uniref:toxin-antitoxin system YwqK family antitoxin n=1 Tax=Flavobacterium fluviatile TaxID=1862387 RepID=UPI0013D17437|nr:toxin-antitoxin system YwqK family antitoxin [Flavobacterium fluviatile]